jgi:hypothetical protein
MEIAFLVELVDRPSGPVSLTRFDIDRTFGLGRVIEY